MAKPEIHLKIEKLNLGAQGIAFINGKVCFVDYVIPGEKINAEIITEKKDYSVARIKDIIKPSSARIKPGCQVFGTCGGCQLQHIDYHDQVELKRDILKDTLRHIGKIEVDKIEIVYDNPWHYRNRAQLPVQNHDGLKIGYFKKGTHEVINHDICYINQQEINQVLNVLRERIKKSKIAVYDEIRHQGNLRHIIIRRGTSNGQLYITFVTRERALPKSIYDGLVQEIPEIVGISQNINSKKTNRILNDMNVLLTGRNFYEEILDSKIFRVHPISFFQVNIPVFEKILDIIKQEIQGSKVIDLYAGVGAIGICVAPLCKSVMAIEENPEAVKNGIENAQLNSIKNITFLPGKVEKKFVEIENADAVVLDPPRKGTTPQVIEMLGKIGIAKIVYLSCNPATLARDASLIICKGYHIKGVYLFDMFPQTYHIEALMIFERDL
ncbi:MAG: 23S rRNA (uracil(1939)-C(5))-methyltransferase RlmD [candidate division WOR-3 bacterium]